jgi:hypothetical protein
VGIITWLVLVNPVLCTPAEGRGGWRNRQGKTAQDILDDMKECLNLTEEQVAQAQPIIEDQVQKRRETFESWREEGSQDRQSLKDAMQSLQEATESQLATILTEEQLEGLRKMQDEQREKRMGSRGGPRQRGF